MPNTPTTPPPAANPIRMLVPPDEKFWKRYSPHHEAPLSGISSFAIHLLAIPLLLLIAWVASKVRDEDEERSLPVDVVKFAGGGGSKKGVGGGRGDVGEPNDPGVENSGGREQGSTDRNPPPDDPIKLPVAKQEGIVKNEFNNDPNIKRLFKRSTATTRALFDMDRDVRDKLRRNVNPGAGQGGGGSGGGMGGGTGTGTGDGSGPGKGELNQREKRQLRWAMTFNTQNGVDYRNQLDGLGAIVAIPQESGQFFVIRNLKDAKTGKVEDISTFNRIYWVDNKPQSVASLSQALNLPGVPQYFAAFFPEALEKKLLAHEMAA